MICFGSGNAKLSIGTATILQTGEGFSQTDEIDLKINADGATFSKGRLNLTLKGFAVTSIGLAGDFTGATFKAVDNNGTTVITLASGGPTAPAAAKAPTPTEVAGRRSLRRPDVHENAG